MGQSPGDPARWTGSSVSDRPRTRSPPTLPGDELVLDARVMDRGFAPPARPSLAWPWFDQLGKDRAGWISRGGWRRWSPARDGRSATSTRASRRWSRRRHRGLGGSDATSRSSPTARRRSSSTGPGAVTCGSAGRSRCDRRDRTARGSTSASAWQASGGCASRGSAAGSSTCSPSRARRGATRAGTRLVIGGSETRSGSPRHSSGRDPASIVADAACRPGRGSTRGGHQRTCSPTSLGRRTRTSRAMRLLYLGIATDLRRRVRRTISVAAAPRRYAGRWPGCCSSPESLRTIWTDRVGPRGRGRGPSDRVDGRASPADLVRRGRPTSGGVRVDRMAAAGTQRRACVGPHVGRGQAARARYYASAGPREPPS